MRRKKKSQKQSKGKDGNGVFVFEAEAGNRAKSEPEFRILRVDHAQDDVSAACPKKRLESIHGELVVHDPPHRRSCGQRRSERDAETFRAQLARERGDKNYARGPGHRRPENQCGERSAQRVPPNPGNEWKKRRLVNVAESKMVSASQVIQRVTKVAVARGGGQLQGKIRDDNEVNPRAQGWPRRGSIEEKR